MAGAGRHGGRARRSRWALFLGIAGVVVILDQLSKAAIVASFEPASRGAPPDTPGGPTRLLGDLLRVTVTHNDGGIFGLAGSSAPLLALASVFVIGVIVWYESRQGLTGGPLLTVALGLLLGGAIGNLIDRARYGYVVDWLDAGVGDLRWYIFNVADSAISLGILGLLAIGVLGDRLGRWGPEAPDPSGRAGA